MSEILAVAAESMNLDSARLQSIAHNLANVATTGFKRESSSRGSFAIVFDQAAATAAAVLPDERKSIDLRPGALRMTGNPLDLAIEGKEFFEVNTPQGVRYTHAGAFRLDRDGTLITDSGFPVSGMQGKIVLNTAEPVIDKSGRVFEQDKQVAQIKTISFSAPEALDHLGNGLFIARGGESSQEQSAPRIRQGHLEASNVSSMHEMVKMIETMRHFESMQKVVQGLDEMQDTTLRRLGEF